MSRVQMLRVFVNQRLTAAAEEIFGLFERTIAEYEEERRLLLQDQCEHLRSEAAFTAKKFTVIQEVPPERQEWSPSLDQEDRAEPAGIKEEEEELWARQEAERRRALEEAESAGFPCTPAPLKSDEADEEEPQSSQLHQSQTEGQKDELLLKLDGESNPGGSEPAGFLIPAPRDEAPHSSEAEDANSGFTQRNGPHSNALTNSHVPVSDVGCNAAQKCFSCSECAKTFGSRDHLQVHVKSHAGEKTFTCPFCGKKFTKSSNLTTHLRVHTGEKPFTCSVCNTSFSLRCTLVNHMRVHTGEKPFSCSVCGKRFSKKANLTTHMALHTEEKPFKCSVCDKRFTWHSQVKNHKCAVEGSR